MSPISKHHRFTNITPQEIWLKTQSLSTIFLPSSLQQATFNHYYESNGASFGFRLHPIWGVLPDGEWGVLIRNVEQASAENLSYQISISAPDSSSKHSSVHVLYSGKLTVVLSRVEKDTEITVTVDGQREVGLGDYSDDLVETIIRSLIRESWDALELLLAQDDLPSIEEKTDAEHMAPLAVAAGVFSAGMALGLWLWRRKRKV